MEKSEFKQLYIINDKIMLAFTVVNGVRIRVFLQERACFDVALLGEL